LLRFVWEKKICERKEELDDKKQIREVV
jgi:hypothetical protein